MVPTSMSVRLGCAARELHFFSGMSSRAVPSAALKGQRQAGWLRGQTANQRLSLVKAMLQTVEVIPLITLTRGVLRGQNSTVSIA
jgi:hypothetical protein